MMPMPEDEPLGKAYDARLMRRFASCLRPYAGLVTVTCVLMLFQILADLVGPLLLREAVDGPIAARDPAGLTFYALLFAAAILATALLEFVHIHITNRVGQNVIFDLRMRLFGHLQRLPVSFFDRNPTGKLTVRITNDVENLNELFASGLVELVGDVLMIVGVVIVMFLLHAQLALVTLAVTPLVFVVMILFRRFARERYREMRRRIGHLNSFLSESVEGMRTIQIFGREKACFEQFRHHNAGFRDSAIATLLAYSCFYPGIELLASASVALLLAYGGVSILGGSVTFGTFLAFWYCAQKFFRPVRELAEKYNILQAAMASSERIFRILDTPPEGAGRPAASPLPDLRGEVAFDRVCFSYDGKTPVLEDVSFRIESGKSLAIVGLTGAGKTTIMNLILRFYEPGSGVIRIDGRDVRDLDPADLRRRMGLVLQDVFLFAGTVEDNIRLGHPGITRERVEEAARAVHAERFVRRLPKGFDTDVMERGAILSSGERQILSFARALAYDPRILILDEATSSVDAETETIIREGVQRLMRGRTSILIAHRLSTIQHADRIMVLHRGRVREEGTHAELLRRDGLYRKLCRLQFETAATGADGHEAPAAGIP